MVTVLLSFFDFDVSVVQCLLLQNVLITFLYKNHKAMYILILNV